MRGHPLRRRTEIEWLTRAGRFDVGGIGNIATPCSVGAKWRFHFADFACDKKQDAFLEQTAVSRPVKYQSALDWTCRFVALRAIAAEDGGAQSPDCWLTPNTALSAPSSSPFAYKWEPELNERSFTLPARPKAPAAWQKLRRSAAPRHA
jgi:hypothetical protein